jgi:uncharacterized protein YbjT (DUF2867 family)
MILVTGATGTVGSEVVRLLAAMGDPPRAFVRDAAVARRRLGEHIELVEGDLDQPETINAALRDVDHLFLLTRQDCRQVDWEGDLIHAAARAGVGRIIKVSVFRADQQSPLQIARQHGQAEELLERSGVEGTILRPVFFMQNLLAMVRCGVLATAAQDGRVAMVDARDVAAVAVSALTSEGHAGKTYTLTGPEALSFDDVAKTLSHSSGPAIAHVRVPAHSLRDAVRGAGAAPWFADDMARLHVMLADGYEDLVTDAVITMTGRPPRTLAQFASEVAAR